MRQQLVDLLYGLDDVGAGLLEDLQHDAGMAVLARQHQVVFGPVDGYADVANAHRGAVLVRDDDIVPGSGLQELVVVVDREAVHVPVDRALG